MAELFMVEGIRYMEELYENLYGNNVTIISNEFLNKYLSDTKPEYIKVFLFYLWKGYKERYSIEDASNELDLDENVVEMALKFWIKKKMMKKECLDGFSKKISDESKLVDFDSKKKALINKKRLDYSEIEGNLLFVAEKLLGKTLSERQISLIAKCYNDYGFDESVIHYLLEYCSNKSRTDARYIKAVADSWYEQNVKTVADAKSITESFEKGLTAKKSAGKKAMSKGMDREEYNDWFVKNVLSAQ